MYLLIFGAFLCVLGIYMFCRGRKIEKQKVQVIETKYKKKIEEDLKENQKQLEDAIKQRQYEQERAREAWDNAEQLILSEQERAAAETSKQREIQSIQLEIEMGRKRENLQALYNTKNKDLERDYILKKAELMEEIECIQEDLNNFKAKQEAVNMAILRQKELDEKEDFYSILIPENDREDIQVLQSMDLKLHNRDVIPKLIWDLFVRRPVQEMAKRVTGGNKVSGIYKITNKKTGEAYVGKTTDISTRWQNHCKTAIGLEGAARTTLHNRLAKDGLWAYTWEILEQVDKDHLSTREAFYIDLYNTTKQLNMKSGDKNGTQ